MSGLLVRCALRSTSNKVASDLTKRWGLQLGSEIKMLPSSLKIPDLHKMHMNELDKITECVASVNDVDFYPLFDERPDKVIGIGLNYKDHQDEQNLASSRQPTEPVIFNKFASTIVVNNANIVHPLVTDSLDYEVELAVVIGDEGRHIKEEDALKFVLGYSIANDITARDWQKSKNFKQWILGKSMNTFCPLGPGICHRDLIQEPHNLEISCEVNGETRQKSNTANMIFKIPHLISFISKLITLYPGDIILTGTPSGVGFVRNPPLFLKPGDEVKCTIQNIGVLTNKVVMEQKP